MIASTLLLLRSTPPFLPLAPAWPVTSTLQVGLLFSELATLARIVSASLDTLVAEPLKETLGRTRVAHVGGATLFLQHSGSGHLPTPSASTGAQYVGVISSLSL